jgi:tRNA(fMet)-specific endonuclease VapC
MSTQVRYLLDTNIASHIAKDTIPTVTRQFNRVRRNAVGISVITEAEMLFGLAKMPEAKALESAIREFLSEIAILPWDSEAARHYAHLRAGLQRAGKTLGAMDMLIAAHALAEDAVLVTNDAAFRRISHLKTEDWTV